MPAWNETHYARAAEFLRLIETARPTARGPIAAGVVPPPPAATVSGISATPIARAPVPAPAAPSPAGPTAAAVFKKIPWKK